MKSPFPLPKLTVLITTPDVERLARFYAGSLGFARTLGTPPGFVALSRGAAEIALTEGAASGTSISLSLLVEDLGAWREAVEDTALVHDIQTGAMGLPTFAVSDPDGNHITISARKYDAKPAPKDADIYLLASHAVRVRPSAEELRAGGLRLTEDRIGALQLDLSAPPTLGLGTQRIEGQIVPAPSAAEDTAWLKVGGLYGALGFALGDDLLITPRRGVWHVRRSPPSQRDEAAIGEANHLAAGTILEAVLAASEPLSLRQSAAHAHTVRGWGGHPPDEIAAVVGGDARLQLTTLLTVAPGPEAGSAGAAWNRKRLQRGVGTLTSAAGEDIDAALSILGLTGDAAEAIRATRRLAKSEARNDAEALTARFLQALMKNPK